jgi:hypothetical protein
VAGVWLGEEEMGGREWRYMGDRKIEELKNEEKEKIG